MRMKRNKTLNPGSKLISVCAGTSLLKRLDLFAHPSDQNELSHCGSGLRNFKRGKAKINL
jgi:hypothetical protein